jgi:hypothetical protein
MGTIGYGNSYVVPSQTSKSRFETKNAALFRNTGGERPRKGKSKKTYARNDNAHLMVGAVNAESSAGARTPVQLTTRS